MTLAILFIRHQIDILGRALVVVNPGERLRCISESGMRRNIIDQFVSDIDLAAVTKTFEIILSGFKHVETPLPIDRLHI